MDDRTATLTDVLHELNLSATERAEIEQGAREIAQVKADIAQTFREQDTALERLRAIRLAALQDAEHADRACRECGGEGCRECDDEAHREQNRLFQRGF